MRRRHAVVVSDEIVAGHYLASLRDSLSEAGIAHHAVLLPPGEETKDLAHFGKLAEDILAIGIERGSMLVALGGGGVGDVTGLDRKSTRLNSSHSQISYAGFCLEK